MEEQVAQKSTELEQYLQRVHELEDLYHQLEVALEDERRARQDEEMVRKLQARSVGGWGSGMGGQLVEVLLAAETPGFRSGLAELLLSSCW